MCNDYWELRQHMEVACGPKSLLALLGGSGPFSSSTGDLALYWREAETEEVKARGAAFKMALPGFSARAILVGGLPHASPEDVILSLPLNPGYLSGDELRSLPRVDWGWVLMQARGLGQEYAASLGRIKAAISPSD